ncbi:MAG: nucleotidyltransferase domain-containing protein [Spirochaetales bacterium]|nr:nucleotidyltransferase domain-containing protein [Spirochaetales bacterium]
MKGSMANGTAKRFSDIDVMLFFTEEKMILDTIIEFDKPLMVNATECPKGILMVSYPGGLCVELDCRDHVKQEEIDNAIILIDTHIDVREDEVIRKESVLFYITQNIIHQYLRLLYKALLKYLCDKPDHAQDLLRELNGCASELQFNPIEFDGKFNEHALRLYRNIRSKYHIESELDEELCWLIAACESL